MNKHTSVAINCKKIVIAAGIFSILCVPAWGQSAGEVPSGQPKANEASLPAMQTIPEVPASRELPSIVGRSDARAQPRQITQQATRPLDQGKASFDEYVTAVTGKPLRVFGKNLFTDVPSTFSPFDSAQVNGDYVIGTGDELQIRGWGMINVDVVASVDRSGAIYLPRVGSVKVAGVKYRDLQGYLKQAISKFFTNFEITASIAQTRSVQIYVVGHAVRPGTYTLNSMSTLLNALFTSGGPNASGSMRNIQLKRGSQTIAQFDLYDVLIRGDKSHDVSLQDGDVLFIAQVGPLVALTGNVKTPAIFEMKGESSLADLISWAGGVDSASEQKRVIIEKTVGHTYETVAELNADTASISGQLASIVVRPTDVIRVFAPEAIGLQAQVQHEYVRVTGEVAKNGVFKITRGETLRDLMTRLGGVTPVGYVYAMQLKRESLQHSQQLRLDQLASRFERDVESAASSRLASTTDKDAIAIQAAELDRQRRIAQKLRSVKAEGRIVLELTNGNAQIKDLPELPLQDGDSIFVPRKPGTVDVLGSVFQPNSFIYRGNRTVKDYLTMAGGETAGADRSEMYVIRADGTAKSSRETWFGGVGGMSVNPGDTVVVPENVERSTWKQSLKEWTAIFYQFGLGAAGLKVLQN